MDGLDFRHHFSGDTAGYGDVRLLGYLLAEQYFTGFDGSIVVVIHRTDNQQWSFEIFQFTSRLVCDFF